MCSINLILIFLAILFLDKVSLGGLHKTLVNFKKNIALASVCLFLLPRGKDQPILGITGKKIHSIRAEASQKGKCARQPEDILAQSTLGSKVAMVDLLSSLEHATCPLKVEVYMHNQLNVY